MNDLNVNTNAANGGETPNTALRFGIVTTPGLTKSEAARLQGAYERAQANARRFNAILPKVSETNPPLAAKIVALPDDLTGFDLAPLFEEAKEMHGDGTWSQADAWSALEYRERAWAPNLENIGDAYNGPIGAHGEINYQHAQIWELAKRHVEAQKLADFAAQMERDMNLMTTELGKHDSLRIAAARLLCEAFGVEGESERGCFRDSQTDEMPANLAALRLIRVALDELDGMCRNSVIDRREWVREELARVEAISKEAGFGPVLEVEAPEVE